MIDLSSIKNYYIACGYTDLCRRIEVRLNLLSMLNKEMVNFSHGVNVVSDGYILDNYGWKKRENIHQFMRC